VVIVVRHPNLREIMAFERADVAGHWQLPQGGLLQDEEPITAAWRELMEETGLGKADVVARVEFPEWVASEWPAEVIRARGRDGRRRGQVQRWFIFDALHPDVVATPDGSEFVGWKWVEPKWLIDNAVEFRRAAYERVLGTL
jgi:8-oxo-dGTP pyrophosphatase MutT (NUDIX family)